MKKLTIIAAMLIGTAAFAQTTTSTDTTQITAPTPVNPQITDAVTQVQHDELAARVTELESKLDEMTRREQINTTRVFFNFDNYTANSDSEAFIDEVANFMKDYPGYSLTIEGHADERGTREYNLSLGEKRASFIKTKLVTKGIESNRIQTVSFGKERPAVLGANEVAWSQNRRVIFVLNK